MTPQLMSNNKNIKCISVFFALIFFEIFLAPNLFANASDIPLRSHSIDLSCNLEKTPLSKCEYAYYYFEQSNKLNEEYKKLTKKLDAISLQLLIRKQREWIKWRDADCEEFNNAGCVRPYFCESLEHDLCIVHATITRKHELLAFGKNISAAKQKKFDFSKKIDMSTYD